MGDVLKYGSSAISGFVAAYLAKHIGSEYATYIGGAVGSIVAVVAGRFLHLTPAPSK